MQKLSDTKISKIKRLDIWGLVAFIDACEAASEALLGIINQPRSTEDTGSIIDELLDDHLDSYQSAAIEILRARKPKDAGELGTRNACLAHWEIRCDNHSEAVKLLADALSGRKLKQAA